MNDKEFAELIQRENYSRDVLGYYSNAYTCGVCGETFLDWPAAYDKATNKAYCDRHMPPTNEKAA
jgi:hypothetical protein